MDRKEERIEKARLLYSWKMQLAHNLCSRDELEWKRALRMAHAACFLLHYLGKGVVEFYYQKDDGEIRHAFGTLKPECDALYMDYCIRREIQGETAIKATHVGNWNTDGYYTYWDIHKQAFRSFKAKNILSIEEGKIKFNKRYEL